MHGYKFIDHEADIAAELWGDTFAELIQSAAAAWLASVWDQAALPDIEQQELSLVESTREELLVSFLSELNYLLYAKKWLFREISDLKIERSGQTICLSARLNGANLPEGCNDLKEEIKAVTFHQMRIEEQDGKLVTRVIFDI